jgi:hypothetical protein
MQFAPNMPTVLSMRTFCRGTAIANTIAMFDSRGSAVPGVSRLDGCGGEARLLPITQEHRCTVGTAGEDPERARPELDVLIRRRCYGSFSPGTTPSVDSPMR